MEFYEVEPTLDNYWRAIILFGNNVASYKFALAKSLYELSSVNNDLVTMEQIAEPFSRHLCEHLKHSPKQSTSPAGPVVRACRLFNDGKLSKDELIKETVRTAFNDVIDRFHIVNKQAIDKQFYVDERIGKSKGGIRITDNFFKLAESEQFRSFENETESRWKLVEQGWKMKLARNLISIEYDRELKTLYTGSQEHRVDITSCRDSLNGYQKGRCFYCYTSISVNKHDANICDVDHFLPWSLNHKVQNINGVWNLVLACQNCNRSKSDIIPKKDLLTRLHKRNEYFINSHLPLRETLLLQTGRTEPIRADFLQSAYSEVSIPGVPKWQPKIKGIMTF